MTKKIIFSSGGTGGHIFPAIGIMNYLSTKGYTVVLVTDPRGNKYIRKNMKFKCVKSTTFYNALLFHVIQKRYFLHFSIFLPNNIALT